MIFRNVAIMASVILLACVIYYKSDIYINDRLDMLVTVVLFLSAGAAIVSLMFMFLLWGIG